MAEEATPSPEGPEPTTPAAESTPAAPEPKVFDEAYVRKLRDEAAGYRKRAQEAETKVEEHETANKSEVEKANAKATKAEQRATDAEARLLRYEVATEQKVPAEMVPLLTGTTREELEAQAALILKTQKPADPDFDGGTRDPAPAAKTPEQEHNDLIMGLFGAPR